MLRAAATALWRSSCSRLSIAAPAMRQVRFNSSAAEPAEEEEEDEEVSTADPDRLELLQRKLRMLKLPKVDKTKLQDAEFIAIAEIASDMIREIDNVREDDPRYFEASDFPLSTELEPHNYRVPTGISASAGDVAEELEARREELDEPEDHEEGEDDEDLSDELEAPRDSFFAKRERARMAAELDAKLGDGEAEEGGEEGERGARISFRFAKRGEEGVEGEEGEEGDEGEGLGGRPSWKTDLREEEIDEDAKLEEYENKISEFEDRALRAMGEDAYINHEKAQKTGLESLKDWYNEYKFVERGGRYSLAEQTKLHAKYVKDFRSRSAGEQDDMNQVADYRSGFVINEVIEVGRHCKVTKGGRVFTYSTLILVGTGKGTAGFGYGKGPTASEATDRAYIDAERNLVSVPLYRGGLATGFSFRKRGSFMKCWTHNPGPNRNEDETGAFSHPVMHNLLLAFGFNNAQLRSWKRRNWHNMLEGFFTTLPRVVSHPEDTARKLGLRLKVLAHEERFDKLKPHYT